MPLLEINLGQAHTYNNNNVSGTQINRTVGIIMENNANLDLPTPIQLINKPSNTISVKKTGDTKEYILTLTFERVS